MPGQFRDSPGAILWRSTLGLGFLAAIAAGWIHSLLDSSDSTILLVGGPAVAVIWLVALWRFNARDCEIDSNGLRARSYFSTKTVPWESLRYIVSTHHNWWGKAPEFASIVILYETPTDTRKPIIICGSTSNERAYDKATELHQCVPEGFRSRVLLIHSTQTNDTLKWAGYDPTGGE
jgi:hypothetical protein